MSLIESDAQTACAMLRQAAQALGPAARRAALAPSAGKDGIAPFTHTQGVLQLVAQPQGLQTACHADELAHARGFDGAVQLPGLVADAHHHGLPTIVCIGFGVHEGRYLLIVGAWCCPLHELRSHGDFSGCDVALLVYAAKYLHKAGRDMDELCLSSHTSARNDSCGAMRAVRPWIGFSACKDRLTPKQLANTLPTQAVTGPVGDATAPPHTTKRKKYCAPLRGAAQL